MNPSIQRKLKMEKNIIFKNNLKIKLTLKLKDNPLFRQGKNNSILICKQEPKQSMSNNTALNNTKTLWVGGFFLKIFISFLKQRFTIFTKSQLYNNKITIATTTRGSLLELFLKAGAPQKYTE